MPTFVFQLHLTLHIMVNFNFSYASGTTLQQMIGFEMAGRVWSSYLIDTPRSKETGATRSLETNLLLDRGISGKEPQERKFH